METKLTFAKGWCKFWSFIVSLFQDKAEGTSTKRVVIMAALFMFMRMVEVNLSTGAKPDTELMWGIILTILGGIGLTLPEWFSPKGLGK